MTTMQSIRRTLALATLAATAFLSQTMHAQNAVRVNVPFAFEVGTQHFAPGTYAVTMLDAHVLSVSIYGKTVMAGVQRGDDATGPSNNYLIFRKYGNRYFMAGFHPSDSPTMATIPTSATERSFVRELAESQANDAGVKLALLENGNIIRLQR